eukprot:m51a1_g8897 putative 2-amino-3-ketobutyrate CoA ligase (423) ;mRNA; r:702652-703920
MLEEERRRPIAVPAAHRAVLRGFAAGLAEWKASGLFLNHLATASYDKGNHVTFRGTLPLGDDIEGKRSLLLQSNNYHGLHEDPRMVEAGVAALRKYGPGSLGSPLQAGILPDQDQLERELAAFLGCEAALITQSGYTANLVAISALAKADDVIYCDALNHASIFDGCRLTGAQIVPYRHNDLDHLERLLADAPEGCARVVVSDAVFSMEGDVCDLPRLKRICEAHGCLLVADEAHSFGVLGRTGRGIEEHWGLSGAAHIRTGTLSKAVSSLAGFVAGSAELISYIRFTSRPYVFSTGVTALQCALARQGLRILSTEPWRVAAIQDKGSQWAAMLEKMGFNTLHTVTPVCPVIIGDDLACMKMARALFDAGIFCTPVTSRGGVPKGTARLRTVVNSHHSMEELAKAAETMQAIARQLGVLKSN